MFTHSSIRLAKVDISIFSAMPEEISYFEATFDSSTAESFTVNQFTFNVYHYNGLKILLATTGLGTSFASSILTLVHNYFQPRYVFLTGTAGGIYGDLKLRDVVIAETAFEAELQNIFEALKSTPFEGCLTHPLKKTTFLPNYAADRELLSLVDEVIKNENHVFKGNVVSSNAFPAPLELFEQVKNKNPYSIDMETSAFYQIAWLFGIPALAVRGISNVLNTDGTDDHVDESDVKGSAEAAARITLKVINQLILKSQCTMQSMIEEKIIQEADSYISYLNLKPHPEGGYYARTFESEIKVKSTIPERYRGDHRSAGSAIYYLLKTTDFSAWHRLKSDETWHFYKGSAVKIHVIKQNELKQYILGDGVNEPESVFQVTVKAGCWFAAELIDKTSYCLVGCTVNPGFDFKDFELAEAKALEKSYPQHRDIIKLFSRSAPNEKPLHEPTKIKSRL